MRIWNWIGGVNFEQVIAPTPVTGPHQVLLRVRAVGICGTDVNIVRGLNPAVKPPLALGHEIAGDIVACGSHVTQVAVGDRVAVDPGVGCGRCLWCRTGQKTYCPTVGAIGITVPGGWQEFMVLPEENCYRLPANLGYNAASQAETLFTVLGGIDKLRIQVGEPVLVIGGGPAGLLFARLARQASNVPVVLAGTRRRRLELARRWGVDRVINVAEQPLEQALAGEEFPVVIEAVGAAQSVRQAVAAVAPRGRVLIYGVPAESAISVDIGRIVLRDLSLLGTTDTPTCWPRVSNLLAGGDPNLEDMITHTFPFSRLPEAVVFAMEHREEIICTMGIASSQTTLLAMTVGSS
jgi:2-desacetyl-2-hydroxyethyl bacteriochlorophyllide A dehydrogenase